MLLYILAAEITLVWAYIIFLRPRLKKRFPEVWAKIDAVELWLFNGSRTFIVSRLSILSAIVIGVHDFLAKIGFDYTPFLEQIRQHIPAQYWPLLLPLTMVAYGAIMEFNKRTQNTEGSSPLDQPQ